MFIVDVIKRTIFNTIQGRPRSRFLVTPGTFKQNEELKQRIEHLA